MGGGGEGRGGDNINPFTVPACKISRLEGAYIHTTRRCI